MRKSGNILGKPNIITLIVSLKLFFLVSLMLSFPDTAQEESLEEFQRERTPLSKDDLAQFKKLDFFEIDSAFLVKAHFLRTPAEAPFKMETTTNRKPVYVKYVELYFSIKGKDFKLDVFQNQELISDPEYYNYLFLPFTDLTNGETTYSGGRYLDLRIPEGDSNLLIFYYIILSMLIIVIYLLLISHLIIIQKQLFQQVSKNQIFVLKSINRS